MLGEHNSNITEGWEQTRTLDKIILHPKWNLSSLDYDLALIKLSSPVELNDHVAPVCLPSESQDDKFNPRSACVVTGWGSTSTEFYNPEYSNVLKQDDTRLFGLNKCKELMREVFPEVEVTERMLCAGKYINHSLIRVNAYQLQDIARLVQKTLRDVTTLERGIVEVPWFANTELVGINLVWRAGDLQVALRTNTRPQCLQTPST